jgi:hyperosmotically inducible protein
MKTIQAIKIMGGALVVVASLNVHAQARDTAVESGAMAASSTKAQSKAPKATKADRALEKKVRGALAKAKGITVDNITVRARGGAVVLQGAVPEAGEIDHATEVAKSVEGVTSVKNALSIRPEGGI